MRGQICSVVMFLLLLSAKSRAETACVDLAQLAHSTVGITRYFDEAERNAQSDVVGIQGTAWFQTATNVVTVGHVATAMDSRPRTGSPSNQGWRREQVDLCSDSALGGQRYGKIGCARIANGVSRRPERCHSDGTT